jgi:hypothetical protein
VLGWHRDGTAGEHDLASHLTVEAPVRLWVRPVQVYTSLAGKPPKVARQSTVKAGELPCRGSLSEQDDAALIVDTALGDRRCDRSKGPPAAPPPLDPPDATWRVEEACRLGFDEPWACQPVQQHQDRDRRKGGADPTDVGDQEGHAPLPDDSRQGEHSERGQGKKRQDDEKADLGVDREEPIEGVPRGPTSSSVSVRIGTASRSAGLSS